MWVTFVSLIVCIPESYPDLDAEDCICRSSRNQSQKVLTRLLRAGRIAWFLLTLYIQTLYHSCHYVTLMKKMETWTILNENASAFTHLPCRTFPSPFAPKFVMWCHNVTSHDITKMKVVRQTVQTGALGQTNKRTLPNVLSPQDSGR